MISVCITTYNGEKYIKEQLDSILAQLASNDEIIISDDGSCDNTLAIIKGFDDHRINVFENSFQNVIKNFEFVISRAKGDYIFLCDQDDIWLNNKVQVCLNDLLNGFDLVLHDCKVFDSLNGAILIDSFFDANKSKKGVLNNIINNSYIGCCMAFNKSIKAAILPIPSKVPMHDSWIGILSERIGKVKFNKSILLKHRKHQNNVSTNSKGKSRHSLLKKISSRLNLSLCLLKRMLLLNYRNFTINS